MTDVQDRIAKEVRARGVSHVSRVLDVNRASLMSYLSGAAREGTAMLIEGRAARLDEHVRDAK
jgi:hypothetical protein